MIKKEVKHQTDRVTHLQVSGVKYQTGYKVTHIILELYHNL